MSTNENRFTDSSDQPDSRSRGQRRRYATPKLKAVGCSFEVTMGGSAGFGDSGPPNFDLPGAKRGMPPPPDDDYGY
jgi:hypothetical protein